MVSKDCSILDKKTVESERKVSRTGAIPCFPSSFCDTLETTLLIGDQSLVKPNSSSELLELFWNRRLPGALKEADISVASCSSFVTMYHHAL